MTKNTTIVILLIVCLGSGAYVLKQHNQIGALETQLAAKESMASKTPRSTPAEPTPVTSGGAITPDDPLKPRPASAGQDDESAPRMMRGISKMMDNPAMNKMIKIQQRATIESMYEDFAAGLNLTEEENKHFMDLLLTKQMKRVELGMKMMGGISKEEQTALMEEIKTTDDYINGEIDFFLNSKEDLEAFEYYEKTTMERTAVNGLAERLAQSDTPLEEQVQTDLTRIMHEERTKAEFTVEFSEDDGDLEKFTSINIETYTKELKAVNENIMGRATDLLNEDQLKEFSTTLDDNVGMIRAQLEMVGGMFGTLGGKQEGAQQQGSTPDEGNQE